MTPEGNRPTTGETVKSFGRRRLLRTIGRGAVVLGIGFAGARTAYLDLANQSHRDEQSARREADLRIPRPSSEDLTRAQGVIKTTELELYRGADRSNNDNELAHALRIQGQQKANEDVYNGIVADKIHPYDDIDKLMPSVVFGVAVALGGMALLNGLDLDRESEKSESSL